MNKKGFTLIELLAVIVILAVIALIATPAVLNIIEDSKEKARLESVNSVIRTAKNYIAQSFLNGNLLEDNLYEDIKEQVKGDLPKMGEVFVDANNNIAIAIKIDKYCYKKDYTDTKITKTESDTCTVDESKGEIAVCTNDQYEKYEVTDQAKCVNYFNQFLEGPENYNVENFCAGTGFVDGYDLTDLIREAGIYEEVMSEGFIEVKKLAKTNCVSCYDYYVSPTFTYNINKENCKNFYLSNGFPSSEIDDFCSGKTLSDGYSFKEEVITSNFNYLIRENIISDLKSSMTFDYDKNKCIEFVKSMNWYETEEDYDKYCSRGQIASDNYSLEIDLYDEYYDLEQLERYGIISNVKYSKDTELGLVYYNCGKGNEFGLPEITDVEIPEKYKGLKVSFLTDYMFENQNIKTIKIPHGISEIGDYALSNINGLEEVIIDNYAGVYGESRFGVEDDVKITYLRYKTIGLKEVAESLVYSNGTCKTDGTTYNYMGGCYIKGSVTNNYISYDDYIWRIMGINADGTIKLIMEDGVTSISYDIKDTKFENSAIDVWFKDYFYKELDNADNVIVEQNFCQSSPTSSPDEKDLTNCEEGTILKRKIGLLTIEEHYLVCDWNLGGAYTHSGSSPHWLMSHSPTPNTKDWITINIGIASAGSGYLNDNGFYGDYDVYVRPIINVRSDLYVNETLGTYDNSYILITK